MISTVIGQMMSYNNCKLTCFYVILDIPVSGMAGWSSTGSLAPISLASYYSNNAYLLGIILFTLHALSRQLFPKC